MFMEPRNRFQGMNSVCLCSLAGRYDDPIPTRFLAPIDCLKVPVKNRQTYQRNIKIAQRNMSVEIGTVVAQFLSWDYLFRIFGIVSLHCVKKVVHIWFCFPASCLMVRTCRRPASPLETLPKEFFCYFYLIVRILN
jgi:hypothetical protein